MVTIYLFTADTKQVGTYEHFQDVGSAFDFVRVKFLRMLPGAFAWLISEDTGELLKEIDLKA